MKTLLLQIISVWGLVVAFGGYFQLFSLFPLPFIGPLVASSIIIPTLIYFNSNSFHSYIHKIGLFPITFLHIWRIPAAFLFFYYDSQGMLPPLFVHRAAWGDLAAGILALIVVLLPKNNWSYLFMHAFGLLDFIVAVGTGVTFSLLDHPLMRTITTLPLVLIPLFGVPLSGVTHIMAFDILLSKKRGI